MIEELMFLGYSKPEAIAITITAIDCDEINCESEKLAALWERYVKLSYLTRKHLIEATIQEAYESDIYHYGSFYYDIVRVFNEMFN